jgi:hypothetical protein
MLKTESALTVALTNGVHSMSLNDSYCTMAICDRASKTRFLAQYVGFQAWMHRLQWTISRDEGLTTLHAGRLAHATIFAHQTTAVFHQGVLEFPNVLFVHGV